MANITVNFEELAPGTIVQSQYEATGFVFVELPGAPLPTVQRLEWPGYRKNVLDFRSGVEIAYSEARIRFTRPHAYVNVDTLNLKAVEATVHITFLGADAGSLGGGGVSIGGAVSAGVEHSVHHEVADIWGVHIRAGATHQRIGLAAITFDDTLSIREVIGDRRTMPKMKRPR